MGSRRIEIRPANGQAKRDLYEKERQDAWSKLVGLEEFTKLDSAKVWHLVSVSLSEMFGTAVLVGLGCSSLLTGIPGHDQGVTLTNIILTFAFAISLCVTIFGHISGCHINPAVSLSGVIFGQISILKFFLYVFFQCLGSCLGIAAVRLISPDHCTANNFCVTLPTPEVGAVRAMFAEAFMAAVLVWAVNAAWDPRCQDKHDSMPVKFGLAVFALALPGAKYSGGSINPARSFGPALMAGNFTDHWVYWVGPMGGSAVASAIYKAFFSEVHPPQRLTRTTEQDEDHPL